MPSCKSDRRCLGSLEKLLAGVRSSVVGLENICSGTFDHLAFDHMCDPISLVQHLRLIV